MSTFITYNDYETRLSPRILDLLTAGDNALLDKAETEAVGIINDRLSTIYNTPAELAKTDPDRNPSLVRWAISIAIYVLYARIPDEQVPERVIKDYDDTIRELEMLQQGKLNCTLSRLTDSEGTVISSRFRMGNNTPRSHDPFQMPSN